MIRAFYSAGLGLMAQQRNLDIRANNVANIQTTGFKKSRPEFSDLVYSRLQVPTNINQEVTVGSGSAVTASKRSNLSGAHQRTDNRMDLAIQGDAYFVVDNGYGELFYTRNGSFQKSIEPDGNYLVTSGGAYVLDTQGNRITIPENDSEFSVNPDGYILGEDGLPSVRIALISFSNPAGLQEVGNSLYTETQGSGEPILTDESSVFQGYLESSNVDLIEEITSMIKGQRVFQLNARMLQTVDEMENTANNLRT